MNIRILNALFIKLQVLILYKIIMMVDFDFTGKYKKKYWENSKFLYLMVSTTLYFIIFFFYCTVIVPIIDGCMEQW